MIHNISETIASFFLQRQFIHENQLATYTYCFELLISTLLFGSSIFLLAWISNTLFASTLYLLTFLCFRTTIGGFHATTYFRCYVLSIISFCIFLSLVLYLPFKTQLTLPCFLFSSFLIIHYAPLEHYNRTFSEKELVIFRKRSISLLVIFSIIVFTLTILHHTILAFYVTCGVTQAAISLFIASQNNQERSCPA